ncbi:E3 ubiquitin-protein ligase UBR4-like isoform X3 [Lineus longissimus]|uniref:E3 ubiquitin-protein ligase UBR4-like isoform X3 n=1 Tax=Lineus longissimus TaxID=88925 RepID=UPI00315DFD71
MAASGAGVECSACVKPLLAASYSSFNKNNLPELVQSIIRSEKDILNHEAQYEGFYSSFVALSAHYISSSAGAVSKADLSNTVNACRVLIKYLLMRLQKHEDNCVVSKTEQPDPPDVLNKMNLMTLLRSLCRGESSMCKLDIVNLTAMLKAAKVPPNIKADDENKDAKETKRPGFVSSDIFSQLTSVFDETPYMTRTKPDTSIPALNAEQLDSSILVSDASVIATRNIQTLQQLNGREILIELCVGLPYLTRYIIAYQDALAGCHKYLMTVNEAISVRTSFQSLVNDINIIWQVFSLPILEPLNTERLEKIVLVAMSCLFAAITAAACSAILAIASGMQMKGTGIAKDDELDGFAAMIVQKSLEAFKFVTTAIRSSTRAGGHNVQNLHMLGAWALLTGLQHILSLTPANIVEKTGAKSVSKDGMPKVKESPIRPGSGKDSLPRPGSGKGAMGFGSLCCALASQANTILTLLLEDLQIEGVTSQISSPTIFEADLRITGEYTAWQRVKKLINSCRLTSLLLNLMIVSFRKGATLKKQISVHLSKDAADSTSGSTSDSNTYYEDDFSSSEGTTDEDEDDDSEPILGHWFEETLAPAGDIMSEVPPPPAPPDLEPSADEKDSQPAEIIGKKEPDGYISLATEVLKFLNTHFVETTNGDVRDYICTSVNEQNMASLAAVIKDVDRDYYKAHLGSKFEEFSVALVRFNHCLISSNILTDKLQDCLLTHLGVCPASDDAWPTSVGTRTLGVLAEVLLLRQQRERLSGTIKKQSDVAILKIWARFLLTMKTLVLNFENNTEEFDDVNVEHMQLLVFLFHSMDLMCKKNVFMQIGQTLVAIYTSISKSKLDGMVPLPLSRILLLFDYMVHYLYDPPKPLIEQVQYNLFGFSAKSQSPGEAKESVIPKTHFSCREVEESYRKHSTGHKDGEMRPRFYNLSPAEYKNQDIPKIDGLACTFILSNAESLNYNVLYNALIAMQGAGADLEKIPEGKVSQLDACSIHYHYLICWRLLASLPPSVEYVQSLESSPAVDSDLHLLHTLKWGARLGNKTFSAWVKDWLVKQSMQFHKADNLVVNASKSVDSVKYNIQMALRFIKNQPNICTISTSDILTSQQLPGFSSLLLLDSIVAKVQVGLDEMFTKAVTDVDPHKAMEIAKDMIPPVQALIKAYYVYIRSALLFNLKELPGPEALKVSGAVLALGSSRSSKVSVLGMEIMGWLPNYLCNAVEKWQSSSINEFPAVGAWRNAFSNDIIPAESYIDAVQSAHLAALSNQPSHCMLGSMKHTLHALVRFYSDLNVWCPDASSSDAMVDTLFPLIHDATTEYLADFVTLTLERVLGPMDGDDFTQKVFEYVLERCQDLLINHSATKCSFDERIFHDVLKFMENHLEKPPAKKAFEKVFTRSGSLTSILLSTANENLSPTYGTKVLKFFNKLFQLAEKSPLDKSYKALCSSLIKLAKVEPSALQNWLSKMIMGPQQVSTEQSLEDGGKNQENRLLLQSLTTYIVKENSHVGEEVSKTILYALIPMGSQLLSPATEGIGFSELMVVMATLAGAGSGSGHPALFKAATCWLELCKTYLSQKNVVEKIQENVSGGKVILHQTMLESTCYLLSYIGDILGGLKISSDRSGTASPPYDAEVHTQEVDSDWADDMGQDDDESAGEDSDEESLNNKLCSFTITQKEYMNQHWYHCHTCKMTECVGVCTVCAKVCHKDHELSYAKYGSFFCDCGAKEDGSCQALVKRSAQSSHDVASALPTGPSPFSMETMLQSSLRRRLSSPTQDQKTPSAKQIEKVSKARQALSKQIETCKDTLVMYAESSNTVNTVLELLQSLMPSILDNYQKTSACGSTARAQKALDELHIQPKTTETSDQLMTATLGSQEGAFENVRMNYSGDQGQTIRQLITAHMLRRVAMCCLASQHGKRQHLAVSHEKGKITILQLSALLKQADSSKRKLTLTRLSSAPIPFTVLSVTGNPCNEDFLAVCGLKDCHVLTFTSTGSVADHLVLHPSLEAGNFIIKALWLPGSQTELAVVTADFVKIYDLSHDAISPQYNFLLPSGKVRDCTFVFTDEVRHMVLMSSSGYVYTQPMEEYSSAKNGPFYITNILEVTHPELKDVNGQVAGGGVSVYYSHTLQLLFYSYTQGKTFISPLSKDMDQMKNVFQVNYKSSNGGGKGSNGQPLVQWTEIPGHPGLVCCMTQTNNNPVVMMIKPDAVVLQEIKVLPAKAKIQDMVAIRHSASNSDQRTTLILLCEDGSLRIYMANVDQTGHWLSPNLQPQSAISVLKPVKKKKAAKTGRPSGSVSFPIDYFEHAQQTNDVEFGGNDVLQIYNSAQIKNRLNTNTLYVASTKTAGFSLDVYNNNNTVMVGVRILVGSHNIERSPSYIEMFGRTTQVNITRARWFDLPFTREESLTADKKVTIFFGASVDPSGVTMIDSVKMYVKTKEAFGWPEDTEDFLDGNGTKLLAGNNNGNTVPESEVTPLAPLPLTSMDRLLASSLEVLDGCFSAMNLGEEKEHARQCALDLATSLLTLPTPLSVQQFTKSLLAALYASRIAYHNHKDQAQLCHVVQCLCQAREGKVMDPENYQRLVVTTRSVAVARASNLVRFAERDGSTLLADQTETGYGIEVMDIEFGEAKTDTKIKSLDLDANESGHFLVQLMDAFWKLHASKPAYPALAPACLPGLTHIEATIGALVEIIHAFTACDLDNCNLATKLYVRMLLSPDQQVSFACKQAMIRVLRPRHRRRRVFIPSPPRCSTPGGGAADDDSDERSQPVRIQGSPQPVPEQIEVPNYEPEPMVLEPPEPNSVPQPSPLEALLGGGNFPPMLDIPPDADDETMVELAIALSLQDQPGHGGGINFQGLNLGGQGQNEGSHYSDTTASAPGSDDEVGSTAATDGSTLRTSPAEHGGSAGSESGGSAIDSISGEQNVSGRSSAYGDVAPEDVMSRGARSETSSVGMPSSTMQHDMEGTDIDTDYDTTCRLHNLRLRLLERLLQYMPDVREVGGVRAIPYMQVILMLTSDLDGDEEKDRVALDMLLSCMLKELDIGQQKEGDSAIAGRTERHEVKLIIMRLLSVLMSRSRVGLKTTGESSTFISNTTAAALLSQDAITYCLSVLKTLLDFWKAIPVEEEGTVLPGQLLKTHPTMSPPDMSPFFLRQYVKGHANDVFEDYPQLLTEMVLRLPYQIKKITDSSQTIQAAVFDQTWFYFLAEYMMTQQAPFVRRQVRKLLLFICGSKDKYRQLRDVHVLSSHMDAVKTLVTDGGLDPANMGLSSVVLPYDVLITLIEHLKACSEVATTRVFNWEKFCFKDETVLSFLIQASIVLDEGVAPVLLQLLQCAICGTKHTQTGSSSSSSSKSKKEKEKDDTGDSKYDETMCLWLVQQVNRDVNRDTLVAFLRSFLLESNSTAVRWQAHALILQIYRNSSTAQQELLLDMMWSMWQELPLYGRKAVQFVDLLGFFSLKTQSSEKRCNQHVEKAVSVLRQQNQLMANHPNANIYNQLQGLVDFDGYYLESDPCLVCNNPEVPYSNTKLTSIKVDSKFTTTTQIVKLVGSHTISKVTLRITDLKRTKMVRTINVFYNNRSVQAVVELKNRPGLWHKAKKVTLTAGQTDVKVEFPLPIVACNLMIEYADFYDNFQASAETLQCPRCSASVPANPGVCSNCGENVFQCHKCRAINYDEKDPFLCNACGFCKYAKFDYTLHARPCCAVDPIENEEDRKKAINTINTLLEKADRSYKQLQLHRPALETLLIRINEHTGDKIMEMPPSVQAATGTTPPTTGASNVNKAIQQLAQRYCGDCKASFDDLSKIIQKVLASRKELVEYDRQQKEAALAAALALTPATTPATPDVGMLGVGMGRVAEAPDCNYPRLQRSAGRCYGCAAATVEHCITLLRALATNANIRQLLCAQGLIKELVEYNMHRGTASVRADVRQLLCLLTKDNNNSTEMLSEMLMDRIKAAMRGHLANPDLGASVRHEMLLLASGIQREDSCWELRVRCVLKLFLMSMEIKNPVIMETITLPCLRILHHIIKPEVNQVPLKKPKDAAASDKTVDSISSVYAAAQELHISARGWLEGDQDCSYQAWKDKMPIKVAVESTAPNNKSATPSTPKKKDKEERREIRNKYLMEKYGRRWRSKVTKENLIPLKLVSNTWMRHALFSGSSRAARQTASNIIESICQTQSRKQEMLDLLTSYLEELCRCGESAAEFLALYKRLIAPAHWKYYLAIKGILPRIGNLINIEIDKLLVMEETTLSSDLNLGYALRALTDLLSSFVEQEKIKHHYKNKLVGTVLNGYLSLKKLVVQRTKLIDETQDKLLDMLEDMTTGTESETKEFMAVCIDTVKKYPIDDLRSPVFIFERLCSIIYPEENDVGEFFISLEKDLQQEDFLQGRMLGNPYSSNEIGLGPLMRDIKNKICQDCELVALLEDDTGMELLVCNKIISLDLPVKDVYKKIWVSEHGEGEAMRVVYRMRGLLGDATEDMVNSLDTSGDDDVDNEEVYKMATVMSQGDGLKVMLEKLGGIRDLVRGKQLLVVMLKLFTYCLKVRVNRHHLIKPELRAISAMLRVLNLALLAEQESTGSGTKGQTLTEQILQCMETILIEASQASPEEYREFSKLCGDCDQLMILLDRINSTFVRSNSSVLQGLMRLIPFLAFGDQVKMQTLIKHFMPYLDFEKFDSEHSLDEEVHLDCFCVIAAGIELNANGKKLKDMIMHHGIVQKTVDYIKTHAPTFKTLLASDSEDWKEFISKPSLRYTLRLLTGLCSGHEPTQLVIADCISILHKLEQVSSDERVGTLAENLLEALRGSPQVAAKIEDVRQQTKAEKKRLAMMMRQKELGALGMTANEKGQVKVKGSVLKQMEDLKEETGLTCCICREGYRYQPTKVLGIYTFTKRANLEEYENKPRKTQGYCTVSHFNLVHVDCHLAAVRHARGREEWESAALQNANTKCNGLLPLWGPQVPESAFASCLARHNTYLQECTAVRDASYSFTVHDLKLLLQRYSGEKSFSDESGGGGRESNMHLLPYMMHMALYVMNTTRSVPKEEKNISQFLDQAKDKWVEGAFEIASPLYWTMMMVHIYSRDRWKQVRVKVLGRLLFMAQARSANPGGGKSLGDKNIRHYEVYKATLAFFCLADGIYSYLFKNVNVGADVCWSTALAEHIRNSDRSMLDAGDKLVNMYEDELLPCESFTEFCDIMGLLEEIPNPDKFMRDLFASV